jgi:superfamily II DNA/RNA helicase
MLPIMHRLLAEPKIPVRALVLVPTRELARQIVQTVEQLAQFTQLKVLEVTGGKDFLVQQRALHRGPDIVVATPGRLQEHLENGDPNLVNLQVIVLDEADRMLDMGFKETVLGIISKCPESRQTLIFSATLPGSIRRLAETTMKEPESLLIDHHRAQHQDIRQQILLADDDSHKEKLLRWLLENETFDKAIVFTNTKVTAGRLDGLLRYQKQRAAHLHGDVEQKGRQATVDAFRSGKVNVLVATDLAARGLDVQGIDLIINFDMSRRGDDYVHRIGRTGRAGVQGQAISLISPNEWNLMSSIERYLKVRFERKRIKELAGLYKGPKKLKASGKAASSKKKKKKVKAAK